MLPAGGVNDDVGVVVRHPFAGLLVVVSLVLVNGIGEGSHPHRLEFVAEVLDLFGRRVHVDDQDDFLDRLRRGLKLLAGRRLVLLPDFLHLVGDGSPQLITVVLGQILPDIVQVFVAAVVPLGGFSPAGLHICGCLFCHK